ncbi:MAG: phage tail assembly protein [Pseudolabrys sp.]|nr:phage tail assembly protein [Pseudolabrys sp.]
MANVEIKLIESIKIHGDGGAKDCDTVVLRAPKYGDVFALGEPQAYAIDPNSGLMLTTNRDDVIEKYLQRLCVTPADPALLNQCGLADSLALRDAVLRFFSDAIAARSASTQT